jgi:hypothetical protein
MLFSHEKLQGPCVGTLPQAYAKIPLRGGCVQLALPSSPGRLGALILEPHSRQRTPLLALAVPRRAALGTELDTRLSEHVSDARDGRRLIDFRARRLSGLRNHVAPRCAM